MAPINIIYTSIEGNTRAFIKRLSAYAEQQHTFDENNPLINSKEISDQTLPEHEKAPFFVFVPTYLTGGNGIDSGFTEIMTNALGEYIESGNNSMYCVGVVGSGNRNFNEQYCLTARKYARQFNAPFLADYELRGTSRDAEHIYAILREQWRKVNA
ncbi:MAG: class Ib ribonucleoside-diphosphate reductase assembly flavoprotein NrdI [Limosilactobacillus sp.]